MLLLAGRPRWPPVPVSRGRPAGLDTRPQDFPDGTGDALNGNDYHFQIVAHTMSRSTLRPVIKIRSTAGTGYTYVTRKSRRNDPDRLVIRKYDPVTGRHVEFREER